MKNYRTIALITIITVILLILIGGVVRGTGSGMGCPDWPKCFGQWIPPTSIEQLPLDYRTRYSERFHSDVFNVYKTWTEYINRLFGVLTGFFILITVVFAFRVRKLDNRVWNLSLAGFILVIFQGWLGGRVVKGNLPEGMISLHMLLALLILVVLISAYLASRTNTTNLKTSNNQISNNAQSSTMKIGLVVSIIVLIQILLGAQVRENVDKISKIMGEEARVDWLSNMGTFYSIHKVFYYLVAASIIYWVWLLRNKYSFFGRKDLRFLSISMVAMLFAEIIFGISMHRFGIPPYLQPLHLLFATLIFTAAYTITNIIYLKDTPHNA
jgi:heme a synthase